ncbi:hypothetical protein JCM10908_001680 [Rhodotorula pacifica]|uniref:uncharacterized protein n=1 Tax=Rhodotorula pacifica TaxID=1495444 RepID=UPI00317AC7A5
MAGHGKKPSPSDPASDAPSSEDITWRDTKTEDDKLAHAVARGKSILWPVTFLSTLGIGIGCSGGGIVKTKDWTNRFYFQVFIATLIGWSVLLVIQGWVSGYFIAILVVVVVWRPVAEGSGAGALLVVQAILGVGTSLVGFYFYFQGYLTRIHPSGYRKWSELAKEHVEQKKPQNGA